MIPFLTISRSLCRLSHFSALFPPCILKTPIVSLSKILRFIFSTNSGVFNGDSPSLGGWRLLSVEGIFEDLGVLGVLQLPLSRGLSWRGSFGLSHWLLPRHRARLSAMGPTILTAWSLDADVFRFPASLPFYRGHEDARCAVFTNLNTARSFPISHRFPALARDRTGTRKKTFIKA